MARINFPKLFAGWVKLSRKVNPKVNALATPNPIDSFLTENNITLADDDTAVNSAEAADTLAADKEREAEELYKAGNLLVEPCMKDHRKCAQSLKSIYRTNPRKLNDWGITVNNVSRIVYAENIDEHAVEMKDLIAKHASFPPGTSPLQPLLDEEGIDLVQNGTDIDSAILKFDKGADANMLKEQKTEERELLINPVIEHLRGIGQVAVHWYASNKKKAGALGFMIDDSPREAQVAERFINPNDEKTFDKVKNNSYLTNLSPFPIKLRPANKPASEAVTIMPNQSYKLSRGYGKIIITNPDTTQKAKIEAEFNR
jgi:hypothetical protein